MSTGFVADAAGIDAARARGSKRRVSHKGADKARGQRPERGLEKSAAAGAEPLKKSRTDGGGGRATARRRTRRSDAGAGSDGSREIAKRETRDALIRAGLEEFAHRGLDVPSLDAICARAGYTRGAFYVHFTDRDDFIVAVMESVLGAFLDAIIAGDGAAASQDDLEQTIERFTSALVLGNPLTGKSGSMRTHHLLDVCARSDKIRTRFLGMLAEAQQRVAAAARAGRAAGSIRDDVEPQALAMLLVALAMGVVQMFELGMPLAAGELRTTALRLVAARTAAGGKREE
jgi:AcrR family transcriptional regulator